MIRLFRFAWSDNELYALKKHCMAGAPPAKGRQPMRLPYKSKKGSEDVESPHQFLARLHRLRWIHSTEHLFPTFPIHCCEFAHELVPRLPFRVFGRANAEREQHRDNPDRNVGRSDKEHIGNPTKRGPRLQKTPRTARPREDYADQAQPLIISSLAVTSDC